MLSAPAPPFNSFVRSFFGSFSFITWTSTDHHHCYHHRTRFYLRFYCWYMMTIKELRLQYSFIFFTADCSASLFFHLVCPTFSCMYGCEYVCVCGAFLFNLLTHFYIYTEKLGVVWFEIIYIYLSLALSEQVCVCVCVSPVFGAAHARDNQQDHSLLQA